MPLFHVCPKFVCYPCVCCGWSAQSAICSWLFSGFLFLFLLWLALCRTRPCLTVGVALSSANPFSYYHLFGPAIYSSPNGLARPLVLLLHHRWAPVSHLFSLERPRPVCFPWAFSALFLTLHHHELLLNILGFPGPIPLFLILRVHGLAINPLLSLLSLLWVCRGLFSLFYIIYYPWFSFSLFPDSFKPIYLFKAHLFIS